MAPSYYDPANEGVSLQGALSEAAIRLSIRWSICPIPHVKKQCILGTWLLQNSNTKTDAVS